MKTGKDSLSYLSTFGGLVRKHARRHDLEMQNEIRNFRVPWSAVRGINSVDDFHQHEIAYALRCYQKALKGEPLGSALAVCANFQEALYFKEFSFDKIVLTGFGDRHEEVSRAAAGDKRICYMQENCEKLPFESRSFDLVFCKEGLHHLARPVLGLYEMLRICRKGVVFVEPYDSFLGKIFEKMGLATLYERAPLGNPDARDNYVFRWNRRFLEAILNSYYLDSGYSLELHTAWLSKRVNAHPSKIVRQLAALAGFSLGSMGFSRGNIVSALILPGKNIPQDPVPFRVPDEQSMLC